MVVLYVVLGALLLLVLLLLIPVRVRVDFQEEFRIQLRYLFLRYTLLPAEEKDVYKRQVFYSATTATLI